MTCRLHFRDRSSWTPRLKEPALSLACLFGYCPEVAETLHANGTHGAPPDRRRRVISVYDTTLRDGEAAPGNEMGVAAKIELALLLEELGVDVIEPGFPAASPVDREVFRQLSGELGSARLSAFCRARNSDIDAALDVARGPCDVQLLAVTSDVHLVHKRRMSRQQAIDEIVAAVDHAARRGASLISVALEDATRADGVHLEALVRAAVDAGTKKFLIADTTGCALPEDLARLVRDVRSWLPAYAVVAVHCHDDLGLAVANTIAGVAAGADEAQVTLLGIGERAGNAALEEVAAVLLYKAEWIGADTNLRPEGFGAAARRLSELIGLPIARNKAIVGSNAFATQAGIHQAGILRHPATYEYLDPDVFGCKRRLIIGRASGRTVIDHALRRAGLPADRASVDTVYEHIVSSSDEIRIEDDEGLVDLCRVIGLAKVAPDRAW